MKIGQFDGESIPASLIIPNRQYGQTDQSTGSIIQWRDASITLGYYWIVLATEYKLLSESGQDVGPTLNELYYAMFAFNRLDLVAEDYLAGSMNPTPVSSDKNGFFIRDDVRHSMAQNFANDLPIPNGPISPDPGHPNQMRSDFEGWTNYDNDSMGDEAHTTEPDLKHSESLDQMTTILLGLHFIQKLVPNQFVKPTPNDEGYHLRAEALAMIKRVVEYLNDTEPNWAGQYSAKEWTLLQGDDLVVHNGGSNCVLASYPVTELMKSLFDSAESEMIGEPGEVRLQFREGDICIEVGAESESTWDDSDVINRIVNSVLFYGGSLLLGEFMTSGVIALTAPQAAAWGAIHCGNNADCCEAVDGPIIIEVPNETIEEIWKRLESNDVPLHPSIVNTAFVFTGDLHIKVDGIPVFLPMMTPIPITDKIIDNDNVHIMLELATLGNVWGPDYVQEIAYASNMVHIPMMYDVLNSDENRLSTSNSKGYYSSLLNLAPCVGPWADPYNLGNVPEEWASANRLFHPGDRNHGAQSTYDQDGEGNQYPSITGPDPEYRGYFPGIDYMVIYNLYHILWRDELPLYERNIQCSCISEITSEVSMNAVLEVEPKFPSYKQIGIPIESYLAHDLTITSANGLLDVKNDLIICSPAPNVSTTLTITDHAQMKLYGGNTITVRAGNKLVFEEGAYFMGGIAYELSPGIYSDPQATLIVEAGAEVHVLSGAIFEPYCGMTIRLEEGAKFIVDDATVSMSFISNDNHWILSGENTELIIRNSSDFVNWNQANLSVEAENGAKIFVEDSYMNLPISNGIHLGMYGEFHATNSNIHLPGSGLVGHGLSKIFITDTDVELDNGLIKVDGGSELFLDHSVIEVGSEGVIQALRVDGPDLPGRVYSDHSEIYLEGAESKLMFQGGELFIPAAQTFQFYYTNTPHGYMEVLQGCNNLLHTGANSVLKLKGENSDDLVLKVHNGGVLSNANFGQGKISFLTCKVDLTSGTISTNLPVKTMETRFETSTYGGLDVWYGDFRCSYSEFQSIHVNSNWSKYNMDHCIANDGNFEVYGGGFNFADCDFLQTDLHSSELQMVSGMTKCNIEGGNNDGDAIYTEESLVEVKLNQCKIIGSGDVRGIIKTGGKLSLKCSVFENLLFGIQIDDGVVLNMSSSDFAGYNQFTNCQTMIYSNNSLGIQINNGYNDFSAADEYVIDGFIEDYVCGTDGEVSCAIPEIQANHNVWPHGSPTDNELLNLHGEDHCTGAGTDCLLPFIDDSPESGAVNCGSKIPIIDFNTKSAIHPAFSNEVLITKQVTSKNENSENNQNGWLKDLDVNNPIITNSFFDHVELEEALIVASSYLELLDTLGNDSIAIDLFYQILTSGLDRSLQEVRWKMQWGVRNMKSGLENMFLQNEINSGMNTQEFHPIVQQYVDVLNTMTDNSVSDSTYIERFYFELNKGQLFNTLGNFDMAYEIFDHLDDCQLDSLEQSVLNKWIQHISVGRSVLEQYAEGISSDSISFNVDTTGFSIPVPYLANEYYFGAIINSPSSVSYVPCGFGYKNLLRQNKNNFSSGVFPNPTNGIINVQYVGQDQFMNLRIIDANGRIILQNSKFLINGEIWSLNLTGVPTGDYVVLLGSGGKEVQHRIIFR